MPQASPVRDILEAVARAIAYEIVRLLDATGRQPLRTNSKLKKQLLSGEAVRVTQGRGKSGRFEGYGGTSRLELYALDYLQWVDSGRKKFAKKVPLDALLQFIKQRGIGQQRGARGRFGQRAVSANQLAWMIQNAIYRNGIRARPVLVPALELGQQLIDIYLDDKFLDGLSFEIEQQLDQIFISTQK